MLQNKLIRNSFFGLISGLLALSTACSTSEDVVYSQYNRELHPTVMEFMDSVVNVVEAGDETAIFDLLDKQYVKDQHDSFLEGRTDQFLTELLCGQATNGKGFKCPGLGNISKMTIDSFDNRDDYKYMHFTLHSKGKKYEGFITVIATPKIGEDGYVYKLVGASG